VLRSLTLHHAFYKSTYQEGIAVAYYIIMIMMASFMRVSYKFVFYQSKCISAIKSIHSTTATYISASSFLYLCTPCCCDACLKSIALRVGLKALHNPNTKKLHFLFGQRLGFDNRLKSKQETFK